MKKQTNKHILPRGTILRNWRLKAPSKHSSVLPKFPLALKPLTSRTTLRKQQGYQTTITMMAGGLQQNPGTVPGQMKQRPNVLEDPSVSLGTWPEPVKPREWKQPVFGEGGCPGSHATLFL